MDLNPTISSKLEPFLLTAKSLKGAAAAKMVENVTSAPGIYVFSEIMDLPSVKSLATSESHSQYWALLELFSYKTYQDYVQNKESLPALNQAQITKLKHLSIVSLASERRILPYSDLLSSLEMPTVRDLEDLIIDAIYLDVLRGRLDQKESQLEVAYTMGRDLPPGGEANILAALKDWALTTAQTLQALDNSLSSLASQTAASKAHASEHQNVINDVLKSIQEGGKAKPNNAPRKITNQKESSLGNLLGSFSSKGGSGGNGGAENDGMDVDEPTETGSKGRPRRGVQPEPSAGGNSKSGPRKRTRP